MREEDKRTIETEDSNVQLYAEDAKRPLSVDEVIEEIGGFGWYQLRLFAILGFLYYTIGSVILQQVVVERAPHAVCRDETVALIGSNVAYGGSNCTLCSADGKFQGMFSAETSVAATFELVCSRRVLRGYLGSVFFFGFGIGSFSAGILADKYGRRKALFMVCSVLLTGSMSFLSLSYEMYVAFRIIAGMGCGGGIVTGFVLMMEFTPNKHRGWMGGFGMNGLWSFGGVVIGIVSALIHQAYMNLTPDQIHVTEWRAVSMIPWLHVLMFTCTSFFAPESPRWLLTHGRVDEAYSILKRAARVNGRAMPLGELTGGQPASSPSAAPLSPEESLDANDVEGDNQRMLSKQKKNTGCLVLFSSRRVLGLPLWLMTTINMACWFTASFSYYGLALNSGNLAGDFYLNFIVNMFVDIPALLLSIPMFNRLGRARTNMVTLLAGGAACIGCNFIPVSEGCLQMGFDCQMLAIRSVLAFLGKFMVCITFSGVFIYTSEAFPTPLRSQGMGISSVSARVGGVTAPLVVLLDVVSPTLPMWIFGLAAIGAGLLCTLLPETLGLDLADDVDD